METTNVNPVTLDIVRDSLLAASNEVFYAFARTSMSPIIYETLDYASGITDAECNLLTQGNGACAFIGLIAPMIKTTVERSGGAKNLHEGDVFIINDPHMDGGTHISDIGMVMPVYYKGDLVAFVGNKAHWADVGGMVAGSFTTDSSEVFQEGLCFSAVKLVDKGAIVEPVVDIIKSNVRFPQAAEGDMWGQIASLRTGFRRICEICDKYGVDVVRASMKRFLAQGEMFARNRLKEIPKGSWEMEQYMDDDGRGNLVQIKVKVTITDDEFIADFRGSSPQVKSPINMGYSALYCSVKIVYMSIINPSYHINDGVFKPLKVIVDDASVLNCERPSPTSCYFESLIYSTDTVWKALAPVFPEVLGAGHMLSVCAVVLSGVHQDSGAPFLIVEPTGGGWGASRGKDGEVGQFCVGDGETYNVPVEMAESRYGIMIEEYNLNTDGKGAGEFRGGSGCVRTYRAMSDGQSFTASFGRNKFPAWGADKGADGSFNYFEIHRANGNVEGPFGIVARATLNKNDSVRMFTCTGGGYGDPLKRDAQLVAMDVKNGYITLQQAADDYGVALEPESLKVKSVSGGRS